MAPTAFPAPPRARMHRQCLTALPLLDASDRAVQMARDFLPRFEAILGRVGLRHWYGSSTSREPVGHPEQYISARANVRNGYPAASLRQAGLVDADGRDAFTHRVVFPLEGNLYGRSICGSTPHLFLPGSKGGLIGECADLSCESIHSIAPDQWAIHVPVGKMKTERMVPVDPFICDVVRRLRFLRSLDLFPPDG